MKNFNEFNYKKWFYSNFCSKKVKIAVKEFNNLSPSTIKMFENEIKVNGVSRLRIFFSD